MGSKLLRAGDTETGFAGMVNRRFDAVRRRYTRLLTGTLDYRAVVFVLWGIVTLLIVPFYMFSQKELAPTEDQSVVFGIVQAAPNATLDQTKLFTKQVNDVFQSFPETQATFQITFPTRRLLGHGHQALGRAQAEHAAAPAPGRRRRLADPGHPRHSPRSARAAGQREFSCGLRHLLDGRSAAARRVRKPARRQGVSERALHLRRLGPEVRSAAGGGRLRPRQAAIAGRRPRAGGQGPLDPSRRQLRQPVQHPGPQLQGHPAGQAGRAADGRTSSGRSTSAGPTTSSSRSRRSRR